MAKLTSKWRIARRSRVWAIYTPDGSGYYPFPDAETCFRVFAHAYADRDLFLKRPL